jgi:hypothetical protein
VPRRWFGVKVVQLRCLMRSSHRPTERSIVQKGMGETRWLPGSCWVHRTELMTELRVRWEGAAISAKCGARHRVPHVLEATRARATRHRQVESSPGIAVARGESFANRAGYQVLRVDSAAGVNERR